MILLFSGKILNNFNKIWIDKYLFSLRHSCQIDSNKSNPRFNKGRIALMKVPGRPRTFWNLVLIIVELLTGDDGVARVIKVRMLDLML